MTFSCPSFWAAATSPFIPPKAATEVAVEAFTLLPLLLLVLLVVLLALLLLELDELHATVSSRLPATAVRLVLPRNRAVAVPACAAQLVQAAVVTRPRVRVGGDGIAVLERANGQRGPGRAVRREARRDVRGRLARGQRGRRLLVGGQVRSRRPAEQVLTFHLS